MSQKITTFVPPFLNTVLGSGPGAIALILKDLDESRASTNVAVADNVLSLPLAPNERWLGNLSLYYQSNADTDIRVNFSAPVGATGRWGGLGLDLAAIAFTGDVASFSNPTFDAQILFLGGVDAFNSFAHLTFIVQNGITPGNLSFLWAQRVSNATPTTVFGTSFIVAHRL